MTQDEIIAMARQAGLIAGEHNDLDFKKNLTDKEKMFAKLIAKASAAKEREAIYQLVMEAPFKEFDRQEEDFDGEAANAMKAMAFSLTVEIRARGEA